MTTLNPSSGSDLSPEWGVVTPHDEATLAAARRQVAARSANPDEARMFLEALGLVEAPEPEYVTTRGGMVHREVCRRLRPTFERWPWRAEHDGPGVARACGHCLPDGLPYQETA